MFQDFIVYALIFATIIHSVYHFFVNFTQKKNTKCSGCPDCGIKKDFLQKRDAKLNQL
jgi:hypothetical protein